MAEIQVDFSFFPTNKQKEAFACKSRELMVGGGLSGAKSYFICMRLFYHCLDFPGTRNALFRKKGSHLNNTTLVTWQQVIPKELYTINWQRQNITVFTGKKYNSTIVFGGLDSNESTDRHSSAEYALVAIDQAEEISEENYDAISRRIGRCKLPDGTFPFSQIITSSNPRDCYLKTRFIQNPNPNRTFIQMLIKDNPHAAPGYLDALKEQFKYRPEILRSLVDGDWDTNVVDNVMISFINAQRASLIPDPLIYTDKRIVVCDPARFGSCETVVYGYVGSKIVKQFIYGQKDLEYTASKCLEMCMEIKANTIAIDECGIGGGLVDILRKMTKGSNIVIMAINSAGKADKPTIYQNIRAEMWFEGAELMNNGRISIPADPVLIGQLNKVCYHYNIGRLAIDSKEDIKPSPDRADACIMGIYALKRALPCAVTEALNRNNPNTESSLAAYDYRPQNREVGSYMDTEQ